MLIVGITAAAIFVVVAKRVFTPHSMHVEVDRNTFPSRGIDISAHNGDIDFETIATQGIEFVYMKASEGATWRDSRFADNYSKARKAGLNVGVYHFFRFDVPGWRQSVNILRTIEGRPISMPIAIDVEEWGNPPDHTTEEIVANLRSMVELLRQNGREPIIYTNKNGYYRFIHNRFDDVGLWICSFTTPPVSEPHRWVLWQHSHKGHLKGIQGDVSFDTFNTPSKGEMNHWIDSLPGISKTRR